MKLFAVTGKPIWHSLSPQLHNAAFETLGIRGRYFRLAASSAQQALGICRQVGISGLNVTAPFKQEMAELMDALDVSARKTGVVNTVVLNGSNTTGYNTDPDGVIGALISSGVNPSKQRVLVLGAGGSARAAAFGLLQRQAEVVIANRTGDKAKLLAREFGCASIPWTAGALKDRLKETDIIIGCLSHSENIIQARWLKPHTVVQEAIYAHPTHLMGQALIAGCRVINGKYWLLHQAAKTFEHFTGQKPDIVAMMAAVNNYRPSILSALSVVGFMGCGKSTVTSILAEKLNYRKIDIDRTIERLAGTSITEIFKNKGEPFFRKLESAVLVKACKNPGVVLDCGGGIVKNVANRRLLKSYGQAIWLWADEEETRRRLDGDETRPVLNRSLDSNGFPRLMKSRIPLYAQAAEILFPTSNKTPNQIADDIIREIDRAGFRRG
jgi:shikimate dehydrogenase